MEWKQIHGINYEISNGGLVRHLKTKKTVKVSSYGTTVYLMFTRKVNGRSKSFSVHREVAKAFLVNHENKAEVNHINGNKLDNRAVNLEWVTRSENIQHCYDSGLKTYKPLHYKGKFGSEHNRSKRVVCLETGDEYGSMSEASRKLKISISSVHWSVKNCKPIFGMHFEVAK